MMKNNDLIEQYLDEILPNVGCELNYTKDYELVIAVMLSAQTTDASVNKVTSVLFTKYKSLKELNDAPLEDIEKIIQPIGLYKNKAKNLKGICSNLIENFQGKVPYDKNLLQTLPGVGNKTAGVIRAEIFKIPDFPVDTHILRISKRLKLASDTDDPLKTEKKLKKNFDEKNWIKLHHQFIHFGRYFCKAQSPKCDTCKLQNICKYYLLKNKKSTPSK